MRIRGMLVIAGVFLAPSLFAQEHPKPVEKAKEPPKPAVEFSKFKFLEGCWRGGLGKDQAGREQEVEEIWTSPSENLLVSTTRYFTKERAISYDFNRIEAVDTSVVFVIHGKDKPEDTYYLKTLGNDYMMFENPTKKEFPQRISYRMASDGALIPHLEGDGPSVEVRFTRIKCPGAEHKIKN